MLKLPAALSGRFGPVATVAVGLMLVAGVVAGAFYAYRTYDYIQHDNDFCLSCHLMQDPYERFARSAHRDLGCKACHQPTLTQRSTMALTQVLQNPDSIATHAEVPSERCAECHVEGDPDRWLPIAQSAGHRIHLESDDPSLSNLQCVQCHSSSLHEFAATDRTCAQAGCHEDTEVRLGRMGNFTIHCASCHDFNAPTGDAPVDSVHLALRPQRQECLSCHAMRQLAVSFPAVADDPHRGSCGSCHQPHEQTTPAQAVESCATSGCHSSPEEITPFHRGIESAALGDCIACHQAHDFHSDGSLCLECHSTLMQSGAVAAMPVAGAAADARPFRHEQHETVACASCHDTSDSHGAVTVDTYAECQACHHAGATAEPCARCHGPATLPSIAVSRRLEFSVGQARTRQLPFDHAEHSSLQCAQCHEGGTARSATATDCASCHAEHHDPQVNCMACHATPPADAHELSAHLTCTGAGCHTPNPFQPVPRTRPFCLSCHQDLVEHRPEGDCADCHQLPGTAGG